MSIERRAAASAFWSLGATGTERAVGFIIFAVILRFVPVGDVGLVALGSMLVELANTVAVAGVAERVIASTQRDPRVEASSFWAHLLMAATLSLLLWGAAPVAASIYDEPRLVWVMRSLSAIVLLNTLVVVPLATLTRDFRYRTAGIMSFGATSAGALSALPFAIQGSGVLALVVQRLVGVLFFVIAVGAVTRWYPKARPSLAEILAALRFSLPLTGSNIVDYLSRTGFALFAGLRLDVVSLGYLRVAQRLLEVLQEVIVTSISRIFLPLFVSIRNEPSRRYGVALRIMQLMALAVVGCFAIAGAAAQPMIESVFGAHLRPAAPVFAVLSLLGPYIVVAAFVRPLMVSCGLGGKLFLISAVNAATTAAVAYVTVPYGLTVLSEALVARGFLMILFMAPFIRLALQHSALPLLGCLVMPVAAGLVARLAVLGAGSLVLPAHAPALVALAAQGCIATMAYGTALLVCARRQSSDLFASVRKILLPATVR